MASRMAPLPSGDAPVVVMLDVLSSTLRLASNVWPIRSRRHHRASPSDDTSRSSRMVLCCFLRIHRNRLLRLVRLGSVPEMLVFGWMRVTAPRLEDSLVNHSSAPLGPGESCDGSKIGPAALVGGALRLLVPMTAWTSSLCRSQAKQRRRRTDRVEATSIASRCQELGAQILHPWYA